MPSPMARPRKPRARKRDYAAEARRRNERARALGFKNYYERRTRLEPGAERPSTQVLRRRRGHASRKDLLRDARPGDLVTVIGTDRDKQGRLRRIQISVIDEQGDERLYWISTRNMRQKDLDQLVEGLLAAGVVDNPSYPLAQFRSGSSARQAVAG